VSSFLTAHQHNYGLLVDITQKVTTS